MAEHSERIIPRPPTVAVIGGGQLARMMQESAIALGITLTPLVETADGSTGRVVPHSRVGSADDVDAVRDLSCEADVLTFEHEHISQELLAQLPSDLEIHPKPTALLFAQDKLLMRERLTELGVPCPQWSRIENLDELRLFGDTVGWPIVIKTPRGGYDGKGVAVIDAEDTDLAKQWLEYGPILAEEKVPFIAEAAALLARNANGQIAQWPIVQSEQVDGVCAIVTAPAPPHVLDAEAAKQAQELAKLIAEELDVTGVLAVELFVINSQEIESDVNGAPVKHRVVVNELAMRPHNSGHWTIDGAITSQFEQHLRAILNMPLGSTELIDPDSVTVMVNLLGSTHPEPARHLGTATAHNPRAKIHLYGKDVRPGRKLGHVSVVSRNGVEARSQALKAVAVLAGQDSSPGLVL